MKREQLNGIRKKAVATWWDDGIVETAAGLGILLIGGIGLLGYLVEGKVSPWLYALFIVLMVALAFAVRKAVMWAKARWAWPHTGYAVVKGRDPRKVLWGLIVVLLLIASAFVFPSYLPAIGGAIGAAILLSVALSYGLRRFYILAALSLLLGVLFQITGLEGKMSIYAILTVIGALEMVLGVARFVRFRREVVRNEG